MSLPPRGKNLPVRGKVLPKQPDDYRLVIAQALRRDLGDTRRAVKTVMRWTGAGERTVKNWFSGDYGPQGKHLLALMRYSEDVTETVLLLAGRHELASRVKATASTHKATGYEAEPLAAVVQKWRQASEIRAFAEAADRYRSVTMEPRLREALRRLGSEARATADRIDPLQLG